MSAKKFDGGKPDMSLIPAAASLEEAAVWSYGKTKYDAFNWTGGIKYSRVLAAMERHLMLLKSGLDYDYEHGRHHAASIRCCAAMLIQFTLEGRIDLDDRIKLSPETLKALELMTQGTKISDILNLDNEDK